MVHLPREYRAPVLAKKQLAPHVTFLQISNIASLTFAPGQYASFLIDTHRRPLSFASLPESPALDFIVGTTAGGVCSRYVEKVSLGEEIRFLAPYGHFTLENDDHHPLLFIATGTGIAPIRSQIQHALTNNKTRPITLIFGNHNEANLLLHDEFTRLAGQHPNFTYIPTLSQPSSSWSGHRDLVTSLAPKIIPSLSQHAIYICGNPNMVKDMKDVLAKHHVPPEQIHTEQYL